MTEQPARYRLRSDEEIKAVQWTGSNADTLRAFCGPDFETIDPADRVEDSDQDAELFSDASHWVGLKPGDWVLKHVDHFTAWSDEAFRAMWEPATPPADHTTLRDRIAEVLTTTSRAEWPATPGMEKFDHHKHGDRPGHNYSISCALCIGDADRLADVLATVLPEPADRAAVLREAPDVVAARTADGEHDPDCLVDELRPQVVEAHDTGTQQQVRPARGDQFEAWLKTRRDAATGYTDAWNALDDALDRYRLHADTGTPLTEHACEGPHCDCPRATEPAPVAQQPAAADYSRSAWEAYRRDAGCACTSPDPSTCAVNHRSGPWLCVCHRLSAELTADERARLFPEQQAAAADGEETP